MNGLDLFSGIGGITKALEGYVRPVSYCENDPYAQAVLLSRQAAGVLPIAPIWDDVRTLQGAALPQTDIIYGGFPCQDISVAGRGAGLAGERSGLFFEVVRLVGEIRPAFVFLENVPAIRGRGADVVVAELASLGYDCRWDVLSAADVGANHRRERWWLLAYAARGGQSVRGRASREAGQPARSCEIVGDALRGRRDWQSRHQGKESAERGRARQAGQDVADAAGKRLQDARQQPQVVQRAQSPCSNGAGWWAIEPNVGRVVNGLPMRVDRIGALGNSVVPYQAREAFERLAGFKN